MEESKIRVKVLGIAYSHMQQGAYMLVLAQDGTTRRIPVVIGTAEAQSIAIRIENLVPPRPMTHDLFVSFAHAFGVRLVEVFIYRFSEGIFYSELLFSDGDRDVRIDSRTSDAIAIAMRTQAPIYTTAEILEQAGFNASEIEAGDEAADAPARNLEELDTDELQERLEKAVADEAYEDAALIQKILDGRKEEDKQ